MKSASKLLSLIGLAGLVAAIVFGITGRGSALWVAIFIVVALAAFVAAGVLGRPKTDDAGKSDGDA